jgi:hypothetical protein
VTCEGKATRAGLLFVFVSVPLACASRNPALEYAQQRRFADNSESHSNFAPFTTKRLAMSDRERGPDERAAMSDRERGPVARFRFRNLTRSVLQVHGSYLSYHHEHQLTESKTALLSTCNFLQSEGGTLAAKPAGGSCCPNAIDLLPDTDYPIDVELFHFASKIEAKAVGNISIAGPEKTFTSATFALGRLVSALPEERRYPTNGDLPIPNENRFVMSFDALRSFWKFRRELSREEYFAPSEIEVLDANRAILRSLLTAKGDEFGDDSGDREFIVNFLDQYCVQYWGSVERKPNDALSGPTLFMPQALRRERVSGTQLGHRIDDGGWSGLLAGVVRSREQEGAQHRRELVEVVATARGLGVAHAVFLLERMLLATMACLSASSGSPGRSWLGFAPGARAGNAIGAISSPPA